MKRLAATAAACALSCSAFAADMIYEIPSIPVAPPMMPAQFDWSGFYIGASGGVATGDFKHDFHYGDGSRVGTSSSAGGFIGGGQIGYDWQSGNWVIGAVADIAGTDYEARFSIDRDNRLQNELSYLGTVRARAGYAWDRALFYGHGGYAYGKTKNKLISNGAVSKNSQNRNGWTIGGGVEYAVTDRLSLGTEYAYIDLGDETIFDNGTFSAREDTSFHSVKALLNIRF